jgi:arylsulfatase A-like enzyme
LRDIRLTWRTIREHPVAFGVPIAIDLGIDRGSNRQQQAQQEPASSPARPLLLTTQSVTHHRIGALAWNSWRCVEQAGGSVRGIELTLSNPLA